MPPYQFGLDGFEERLDSDIVVAIAFARHRYLEPVLAQEFLIIMRTILQPTICVMDAAFGRRTEHDCHVQGPDRQIPFHSVRDRPTNDPP